MMKDKKFIKILKGAMKSKDSEEILLSPQFLHFINKESQKKGIDPFLFYSNNNKFMKQIKH